MSTSSNKAALASGQDRRAHAFIKPATIRRNVRVIREVVEFLNGRKPAGTTRLDLSLLKVKVHIWSVEGSDENILIFEESKCFTHWEVRCGSLEECKKIAVLWLTSPPASTPNPTQ
jgi:hypothetical protein